MLGSLVVGKWSHGRGGFVVYLALTPPEGFRNRSLILDDQDEEVCLRWTPGVVHLNHTMPNPGQVELDPEEWQ